MRRRSEQSRRLLRAQPRHLRQHADAAHPEAAFRQLLPGGRDRAMPAPRLCPRARRGLDVCRGHEHPQGAEGGREDGRIEALHGPGVRNRLVPERRY